MQEDPSSAQATARSCSSSDNKTIVLNSEYEATKSTSLTVDSGETTVETVKFMVIDISSTEAIVFCGPEYKAEADEALRMGAQSPGNLAGSGEDGLSQCGSSSGSVVSGKPKTDDAANVSQQARVQFIALNSTQTRIEARGVIWREARDAFADIEG